MTPKKVKMHPPAPGWEYNDQIVLEDGVQVHEYDVEALLAVGWTLAHPPKPEKPVKKPSKEGAE